MTTDAIRDAGTAEGRPTKPFTRYLPAVARILMGLPLIVFGLNGF